MDNVACVVMYCDMEWCVICETLGRIESMFWWGGVCGIREREESQM